MNDFFDSSFSPFFSPLSRMAFLIFINLSYNFEFLLTSQNFLPLPFSFSTGSYSIAVHIQFFRSLLTRIEWFTQLWHPFQKSSSSVSSEYVTGSYPNSELIFITASPVVR